MPAKSYDEIDSIATRMQEAGAPLEDIQQYVRLAIDELQASSGGAAATAAPAVTDNLTQMGPPAAPPDKFLTMSQGRGMFAQAARDTAPMAARIGVPLGATIATGGLGAPALVMSGVGAASALTGEAAAQGLESGRITDKGQLVKSAALGAVPMTRLIGGTGWLPATARVAGEAGKFAALEALGETARKSINEGKLTRPYDTVEEAARALAVPAVLGAGFAGVGEAARKIQSAGAQRAERLAIMQAAGIERPTLDLIFPSQAAMVNRMAAINPNVAKLRLDATQPLLKQFEALAEGAPGHESIYGPLRPYIGRLDAMRDEVAALEKQAATARDRAAGAAEAAAVTPELKAAMRAEALAAEMNAVNGQARMLHEAQANLGGFLDYDATAQQFGEVVDRLFQTRKAIGADRFAASGVPVNAPVFAKSDLVATARKSLERWRGTDLEKRILSAIEDAGGEAADALTLGQFRELRTAFSDRFAGMDPRQLASAEAAGKAAYGALTESSKQTIAKLPGANLDAYNAAVAYWRDTAEAASSRYARPLLAQEASESTFQTLAQDLAGGKKAEVRAFNDFVQAVAQDAPEVAQLASQRLTQAVRNSFIGLARTATGIDPKKLTDALLRAQNQFEVGALGFGSVTDIRRWADSLREFNVRNLAEADLDRMFADPKVQQALSSGKPLGDALQPAVARAAFEQRVNEQALRLALGQTETAAKAAKEAERAARAAGLTLKERQAALAAIEADPIMQAFAGKQTWGIPEVPGQFGDGINNITRGMLNLGPDDGLKLVRALRQKNPDLAEQLQRRVLADVMQKAFRPANTPGSVWALNKAEVQHFFEPRPGSNEFTHLATVRAMVGEQRFAEMKKMLNAVRLVHDVERAGGVLSTDGSKTIYARTGIGNDMKDKLGSDAPTAIGLTLRGMQRMVDRGRYHVLANLASPGPFRNAFWRSGGNLRTALDSMGPQRMFLLARDPALQREVEQELSAPE